MVRREAKNEIVRNWFSGNVVTGMRTDWLGWRSPPSSEVEWNIRTDVRPLKMGQLRHKSSNSSSLMCRIATKPQTREQEP